MERRGKSALFSNFLNDVIRFVTRYRLDKATLIKKKKKYVE